MLAKLARSIPDGDGWLFEPKWDGFRCIVFRDGDDVELISRKLRPLGRYFPELLDPMRQALPTRCVVDGEIVVADAAGHGLDFDALLQRIHPAESRITRLADETPAAFVAFDLLAIDERSLLDDAMVDRRAGLVGAVEQNDIVRVTPATTDRAVAAGSRRLARPGCHGAASGQRARPQHRLARWQPQLRRPALRPGDVPARRCSVCQTRSRHSIG